MILYRFRIFRSLEGNGTMTYDNDIYKTDMTDEQFEPFKESLAEGRIATIATPDGDNNQTLLVISLDKKAIADFYHGFHFCLDTAANWDKYFFNKIDKEDEHASVGEQCDSEEE